MRRQEQEMIFESHAHYDDEAFDNDREQLLASLKEHGIGYVINVAASIDSVRTTQELMKKWDFIYGALGVHPSETEELNEENFAWLKAQLKTPKTVAVGEIGLDYYWDKEDTVRKRQKEWFARQLVLAKEADLPVIIHSRDAAKDTWDVMSAEHAWEQKGVVHCFSYTKETARDFLKWDYYFGIGGVVTFKNAKKLKEAVDYIPMERILLETDSPYLSPVPYRGKRNSSLNLPYVVQEIAQIKGISEEQVMEITCRNAKELFKIQ